MKKTFTLLTIIIFGFVAKTKAQCQPFAGNDGGICGMQTTLHAQLSTDTSTCQWVVASTPVGGSAFIANENDTITSVDVNVYGLYEFKLTETNGNCTGVDIVRREFIRIPNGGAGINQQVCGKWVELEAWEDASADGSWLQAPVTWVDSLGSTTSNPSARLLPNTFVYNHNLTCTDTVEFVWKQFISGAVFPTAHCVQSDTVKIIFGTDVVAETQGAIPDEVCGKFLELNSTQTPSSCGSVSGYWIDYTGYVSDYWLDTNHTIHGNGPHTIAQNVTYNTNSFAYVVRSGACTDTSNFQEVTFVNCLLDIEQTNNINSFTVYPNPAKNQLTINNVQLTIKNIEILDITGKETNIVCNSEQNEESISIDISNLKAGIYFIKVGNNIAKFIKE